MKQNFLNPDTTLEPVGGTVCGRNLVIIEDFNQIKCPICGESMHISGMECDFGGVEYEQYAMRSCDYVDAYGLTHYRVFGRDKREEQQIIHMSCPNECVRDLALNIKQIHFGPYREFIEHRR